MRFFLSLFYSGNYRKFSIICHILVHAALFASYTKEINIKNKIKQRQWTQERRTISNCVRVRVLALGVWPTDAFRFVFVRRWQLTLSNSVFRRIASHWAYNWNTFHHAYDVVFCTNAHKLLALSSSIVVWFGSVVHVRRQKIETESKNNFSYEKWSRIEWRMRIVYSLRNLVVGLLLLRRLKSIPSTLRHKITRTLSFWE